MKKLCVFLAILCCFLPLTACGDARKISDVSDEPQSVPAHEHTGREWQYDIYKHWQVCSECGLKINDADHTPDENGFCTVCGQKVKYSRGLQYKSFDSETCYVCGIGTCKDTELIIPKSYQGFTVTEIGTNAFDSCDQLIDVHIPDGVTVIGSKAFSDCKGLKSITLYGGLKRVEYLAFWLCTSLNAVYLTGCTLSDWCKISFLDEDSNPLYYAHDLYLNGTLIRDLTIPDDVTAIGTYAFSGCTHLTSVTIPNCVRDIGAYAFAECAELTEIVIPDQMGMIGSGAFLHCIGLTSISLAGNIKAINSSVFKGCRNLTSITVPDGVTSIKKSAFEDCVNLQSVTIPASVKNIADNTFHQCSSLTDITFGGTKSQWNEVKRDPSWAPYAYTESLAVHCEDGDIKLR